MMLGRLICSFFLCVCVCFSGLSAFHSSHSAFHSSHSERNSRALSMAIMGWAQPIYDEQKYTSGAWVGTAGWADDEYKERENRRCSCCHARKRCDELSFWCSDRYQNCKDYCCASCDDPEECCNCKSYCRECCSEWRARCSSSDNQMRCAVYMGGQTCAVGTLVLMAYLVTAFG